MDIPPPDPAKLLADWMAWERGEETPGRTIANLKTHGLRQVLEELAAGVAGTAGATAGGTGTDQPTG